MTNQQNNITRLFHWSSALVILGLIGIGFYMTYTDFNASFYYWHKSVGVIAAVLIIARLVWRYKAPWQSSAIGTKHEKLASSGHKIIIALMVLMPLSGLMNSGFGGYSVYLFDWVIVPKNLDAAGNIIPFNPGLYKIGGFLHGVLAYVFTFFVVIHILASLKHHFIDKDNTLNRMLNRAG